MALLDLFQFVISYGMMSRTTVEYYISYSNTTTITPAMCGTSFYILTTGTRSQSWWRLPTWSRNVDK